MALPQLITRLSLRSCPLSWPPLRKEKACLRTVCWPTSLWFLRCENYYPIALLNSDLKMFAKILANQLLPHIPCLIYRDLTGFLPLCEPRDITIRVLNLIHAARTSSHRLLLAFDRVNWQFMQATLEHIDLGYSMLRWILSLFSCPLGAVKVNETRSDFFVLWVWILALWASERPLASTRLPPLQTI